MTAISKTYEPKQVELKWYRAWLEAGAFKADADPKNPENHFCIMIPPPNVTGVLHIGHVLVNTLQDLFIRRARLEGRKVLWMPGMDHASIATHARVEEALRKEGKSRREMGREAFVKRCWEWSNKHGGIILEQLRQLGCSCDWDRTLFTMDEGYERAVLHSFVEFYRRGYIYRGKYMTNWCPVSQTALSNEEVIMTPQRDALYKMRYEIVESPGTFVEISTTRPETLMGDTGVAVHPKDSRYQHLLGGHVWRPFPRAQIPIIADEAVDREFGTGVLKVTPAHDPIDYEIGQRHDLPTLDIMNPDGTLNELAGEPFVGIDRFEARALAAKKLQKMGLLVAEELYEHNVGISERGGVPIEPRLTDQWWLRFPKVEEARRAVEKGYIQFHPDRWKKVYLHWLGNLRGWCISRQLWWGQRIPVWYRKGGDRNDPANWHVSVDGPDDAENWEQEEDVLDTWASSNLWPFATLGWPHPNEKQREELSAFYPTDVLVTGFDIIFFWVARMIMSGLELYGERRDKLSDEEIQERRPFRHVYIHGLVRDRQRRKFQKSLGNSPDPLDLFEKFGADGTRFGILNIAPSGQDILFSEERLEIGRNICNKLWNACRFRQMSGAMKDNGSLELILARIDWQRCDRFDHWILHQTVKAMKDVEVQFARFEVQQMTHTFINFFWGDICDWYLEASKEKLKDEDTAPNALAVQDLVIRQLLLLMHPMIPHITEELWNNLGYNGDNRFVEETTIENADDLVDLLQIDPSASEQIEGIKEFVTAARALKAEYKLANRRDSTFFYTADREDLVEPELNAVKQLIGAATLERTESGLEGAPAAACGIATLYLDLAQAVDVDAEKDRLGKELLNLDGVISGLGGRLKNESFLSKAPKNVVQGARDQLAKNLEKRAELEKLLAALG